MPPEKVKVSSPDYPHLARLCVQASVTDAACKPPAGLYLVATPIGHLGDISLRALVTLSHADIIACEDTRNSGVLLRAFGIDRPTLSLHDHNEEARQEEILGRIAKGDVVAVISDAGMPAIADPGFKLVRACHAAGQQVVVIPGANAAVTAMAGSGLATDAFHFAGFLPPKSAARRKDLTMLKQIAATLIFYESPSRLAASLADMVASLGGDRSAAVARELTKFYEETRRGTLAELAAHYATHDVKGEIVILVGRGDGEENYDIDALLTERLQKLSVRDAVAEIASLTGGNKKEIYARALALSDGKK